jgi:hypothetical protein
MNPFFENRMKSISAKLLPLGILSASLTATCLSQEPLTYRLENGWEFWEPGKRQAIMDTIDNAIAVYNQHGYFPRELLVVNADPFWTPTADANFAGRIQFGGQYGLHTGMHEVLHTLGIGTITAWNAHRPNGVWDGEFAINQVRQFDGPGAFPGTDNIHFWPYGLNFASEYNPAILDRTVKMATAFRRDMGIIVDIDGDDLPDHWEKLYFINLSQRALKDFDNDGSTNLQEYQAGTNPADASSNPSYPLVGHFPLDASSGLVVPATNTPFRNGFVERVAGGNIVSEWAPSEGHGGALQIKDIHERVRIPAISLTRQFSVMGWIKPDAEQNEFARFITNNYLNGFYLGRNASTSEWMFIINQDLGLTGGAITADEWQHVAGIYDGVTAKLFVNGQLVGEKTMNPPKNWNQYLFLGTNSETDRSFTGFYDEIRFFRKALSAAELQAVYDEEAPLVNGP